MIKTNQFIGKVKYKYCVCNQKFGAKIPKSVAEAKEFYEDNGNKLWWDNICKETENSQLELET